MALGRVGVQIRLADWLFAHRSIGRVLPADVDVVVLSWDGSFCCGRQPESKDEGQLWLWVYPGLTTESLFFAFC